MNVDSVGPPMFTGTPVGLVKRPVYLDKAIPFVAKWSVLPFIEVNNENLESPPWSLAVVTVHHSHTLGDIIRHVQTFDEDKADDKEEAMMYFIQIAKKMNVIFFEDLKIYLSVQSPPIDINIQQITPPDYTLRLKPPEGHERDPLIRGKRKHCTIL